MNEQNLSRTEIFELSKFIHVGNERKAFVYSLLNKHRPIVTVSLQLNLPCDSLKYKLTLFCSLVALDIRFGSNTSENDLCIVNTDESSTMHLQSVYII